jgi:serine/threonine protein kinase
VRPIYLIDWMIKISLALKKLHDNQLIHFDIKPPNILMLNEFQPVIADLGMTQLKENAVKK